MSSAPMQRKAIGDLVEEVSTWNPSHECNGTFRYIDIGSIDQIGKTVRRSELIPCSAAPSRARQIVKAGDVLVSTVRPNLNAVAQMPQELDGATASTGFCVLRPRADSLESSYLFHWVKTPRFISEMVRLATGASYPAVSDAIVKQSLIPLPPIHEQRRIAAMLDKAYELRAKRRVAITKIGSLVQSIFFDMFGDPVRNEKNWKRVLLGGLLEAIESGWSPVCLDRPAAENEWGVLKLGAVTWCIYDDKEQKALPPGIEPRPELEVKPGDLLFTRKNTHELVAATAHVRTTRPNLMLSDLIFRLRLLRDAPVEPEFLQKLLISPSKRLQIQKLASGSAGSMPNISKERLGAATIELPPIEMQRDFARRVSALECLQSAADQSLGALNSLFVSLERRAFRGEL